MLPLPLINYIPKALADNIDARGQAFVDKIEDIIEALWDDAKEMYYFKDPERCYATFIVELGQMLEADIREWDSEVIRRRKVQRAVYTHKNAGLFDEDVKVRIDNITGFSASLFPGRTEEDDLIFVGDGELEDGTLWAVLGGDGADPLGIMLAGAGDEYILPGYVWIDCGDSGTLTATQISQILEDLTEGVVPAYYVVLIGYTTAGVYTEYDRMG